MARPKKGKEKRLKCDFRVRITEELRAALDERVSAEGKTITDVITPILERELLGLRTSRAASLKKPRDAKAA
jgi:hypothetical protein